MTINATLQVRLNGGAPASGGVDAAAGDVVQITAPDKTGWKDGTRAQIWAYSDPDFACPAGFTDSGDDPATPTYHVITRDDPPTFVIPEGVALSLRWLVRDASGGMVEGPLTIVRTPFANGVWPIGAREQYQFGGNKLAVAGPINENFKTFGEYVVSAGLAAVAAPPSIGAASSKGVDTAHYALEDHTHGHGSQTTTTHHAVATTSGAGFASASHIAQLTGEPSALASVDIPTALHAPKGTRTIQATATLGAAIEAAQSAGYAIELVDGATYTQEKKIDLVPNLPIFCSSNVKGGAEVISGFSSASGADSDDGNWWRARSIIAGSPSGVHNATSYPGGRFVLWSFNPTIGAYYVIVTSAGGTGFADQSLVSPDTIREIVRVAAVTNLGGGDYRVELDRPLVQPHMGHPSSTPRSDVYLVTTLFDTLSLKNIHFNLGTSNHAVAVLAQDVWRVYLTDVHVTGGSRAAIRIAGSGRRVRAKVTHHGGTNCAIMMDSPTGEIEFDSEEGGARSHASGIPRGLITIRGNGSLFKVKNSYIAHGCTGLSYWGGIGIYVQNTLFFDNDPKDRAERDPDVSVSTVGSRRQVPGGIDQGGFTTGVPGTLKAFDNHLDGVDFVNCGGIPSTNNFEWPSVLLCDVDHLTASRVGIHCAGGGSNGGLLAYPNKQPMVLGIMAVDAFKVTINQLDCFGVTFPVMYSSNGASRVYIETANVHNFDGYTSVAPWLASFEDSDGTLEIGQLNVTELTGDYALGQGMHSGAPAAGLMQRVLIRRITETTSGLSASMCRFYKATASGSMGQRWESYSNSGERSLRAPSDTRQDNKVFTLMHYGAGSSPRSFDSGDWVLAASGDEAIVASSEDPLLEAIMVAGTTTDVIEYVPGATYAPVGTVKRRKNGGSYIQIERVGAGLLTASSEAVANTLVMRGTGGAIGKDNGASPAVSLGMDVECGQYGGTAGQTGYLRLLRSGSAFLKAYKVHASSAATIESAAATYLYLSSPLRSWLGIDANGATFPYVSVEQSDNGIYLTSNFVEVSGQLSNDPVLKARNGALAIDMTTGTYFQCGNVDAGEELTGDITWGAPSSGRKGVELTLRWRGDGTQTVAFNAVFKFGTSGSNQQPASPAANDVIYICVFKTFDGVTFDCISSTSRGG